MFTRQHLLCAEGSYFSLSGEISYFHQQLVTLEPPKQKSNPNPLDNGPLNPLGLVMVIASVFNGKQCEV